MRFDWRIWKMENGTIAIEILQIVFNDVWILFFLLFDGNYVVYLNDKILLSE